MIKAYSSYVRDFIAFNQQSSSDKNRFPKLRWKERLPCLNDATLSTEFDRHYVYHLAWAARVLAETRPKYHVDISSSLYLGAIVSAFIPIEFYDSRPPDLLLPNLSIDKADLILLPFEDMSVRSLSCLHVIEHIGLGRYGDSLDPDGDLKAASELKRVLAIGGELLIAVPIGKPKIVFNAHRIYSYDQVVSAFSDLKLKEFALVPDDAKEGGLVWSATREMANAQKYGCGCFRFTRQV